jgi:hypothetical protein
MTALQLWRDHPEKSRLRRGFFQVHFWVGAIGSAYILLMSVSGSVIVFRNELVNLGVSVEWMVRLHTNLLGGTSGRLVNGIGSLSLVLLCVTGAVIWWPGVKFWRRSLAVEWRASFARINWDVHSALGFWGFAFVTLGGSPESISCSQTSLLVRSHLILPGGRRLGWHSCISVGLAGLPRPCGPLRGWSLPCSHSRGCLSVVDESFFRSRPPKVIVSGLMKHMTRRRVTGMEAGYDEGND